MFIQLLTIQHFDLGGKQQTYRPGDWVDIGKQTALRLIVLGQARSVTPIDLDVGETAVGIMGDLKGGATLLARFRLTIPVSPFEGLTHAKMLLWDPKVEPRMDLLAAGFGFLAKWEIAAPLLSYDLLARDIGNAEDRERTQAVIRDLRVPVYDTRLIFMRRTEATDSLVNQWRAESGDRHLAFMRALYRVKPLILALPTTWRRER